MSIKSFLCLFILLSVLILGGCRNLINPPIVPPTPVKPIEQVIPEIDFDPIGGYPGDQIRVLGNDWPAGQMVLLVLADEVGRSNVLTASITDEQGQFETSFYYPMSQRWGRSGLHTLVAYTQNSVLEITAQFAVLQSAEPIVVAAPPASIEQEATPTIEGSTAITVSTSLTSTATPTSTLTPTPIGPLDPNEVRILFDDNPRNNRREVSRVFCSGFGSDCDFAGCAKDYRLIWGPYCRQSSYPYIRPGGYRVTLHGIGPVIAGATDYGTSSQLFGLARYELELPASYIFCWPGRQAGGHGFETIVQSQGEYASIDRVTIEYLGTQCLIGQPPVTSNE